MPKARSMKVSVSNTRKYVLVLLCCLFYTPFAHAQFSLRLHVKTVPPPGSGNTCFVAGNFNNWNPGDSSYILTPTPDGFSIVMHQLEPGMCQFKITRGTWQTVEVGIRGSEVENHFVNLQSDTSVSIEVAAWKDAFRTFLPEHTSSPNVHLPDTAFEIPQLNRRRRIWVYLPPGYDASGERYPVIYMQDGQNLFDAFTAPFGEWGVDECLDTLISNGSPACIVVGIDNGGSSRMSEYNPYPFIMPGDDSSQLIPAEGDAYTTFLVETLKPYIDAHYRTVKNKENTIIAGSSMGGLIAFYAALRYPEVFWKAGIFSPAFWTASGIDELTDSLATTLSGKYFFYIGGKEGQQHVEEMVSIQEKLAARSRAVIYSVVDPEAEHNEKAWRKWFPEFYKWVTAKGFNFSRKR